MRFFTYTTHVDMSKAYDMFAQGVASALKHTGDGRNFEHLLETVEAAASGSLDVDQTNFNHFAYEARAKLNSTKKKPRFQEYAITSDLELKGEETHVGTIPESKVAGHFEEAFDLVESEITLRDSLNYLLKNRYDIIINTRIDPLDCLRASMENSDVASKNIRVITEYKPEYHDMIMDIICASQDLNDNGQTLISYLDKLISTPITNN